MLRYALDLADGVLASLTPLDAASGKPAAREA